MLRSNYVYEMKRVPGTRQAGRFIDRNYMGRLINQTIKGLSAKTKAVTLSQYVCILILLQFQYEFLNLGTQTIIPHTIISNEPMHYTYSLMSFSTGRLGWKK